MSTSLELGFSCCKVIGYPGMGGSWKMILSYELHRTLSLSHSHLFLYPVPPSSFFLTSYQSKVPSNPSVESLPLCRKIVKVGNAKQSKTVSTAVKSLGIVPLNPRAISFSCPVTLNLQHAHCLISRTKSFLPR